MIRVVRIFLTVLLLCQCFSSWANIDTTRLSKVIANLERLGEQSYNSGDYVASEKYWDSIIVLSKTVQNYETLVKSFNYKHVIALSTSNLKEAESTMDSASLYAHKYLGDNDLAFFKMLGLQGYNAFVNRNYTQAIAIIERANEGIARLEEDPSQLNHSVKNLVDCYRLKGDFEDALRVADERIKYLEQFGAEQSTMALVLLQTMGNILDDMNDPEASMETLNAAKSKLHTLNYKEDASFALYEILGRQAKIYFDQSQPEKALSTINQAMEAYGRPLHEQEYFVLSQKGRILKALGNLREAEKIERANLNNSLSNNTTSDKVKALCHSNLAHVYHLQGSIDSAKIHFDETIRLLNLPLVKNFSTLEEYLTVPHFNINSVRTLSRIAAFDYEQFVQSGNLEKRNNALRRYQQAFRGTKFLQKELNKKSSKIQLNSMAQEHFGFYIQLLLDVYNEKPNEESFAEIFQVIEDNKSILLKEDVYEKNLKLTAIMDRDLLNSERSIQEQMNALNRNIKSHDVKGDEEVVEAWKTELHELDIKQKKLKKTIERQYPEFYKSKYTLQNVDISNIQKHLSDKDIYLNYYQVDSILICAWLTTSDYGIQVVQDIQTFNDQVNALITMSRTDPSDGFTKKQFDTFKAFSHSLYKRILPHQIIKEKALSHLIIGPTHNLNYLPFEVLSVTNTEDQSSFKSMDFVIKHHTTEYALSSDLWIRSQISKGSDLRTITSYAPFVNGSGTSKASGDNTALKLKCSEDEVDNIARLFDHAPIKGEEADLDKFKNINSSDIIHFATHAYIEEDSPELSRLQFYDGHIAIQDLETMALDADLVVLSACNTGSGVLKSGEGVIHLGKGFVSAGVGSLVNTLWAINDCATEKIITGFYSHLKEQNISKALQKAKIDYIDGADKLTAHPYYWSALIFSGNKEVFVSSGISKLWLALAFSVLFLLIMYLFKKNTNWKL